MVNVLSAISNTLKLVNELVATWGPDKIMTLIVNRINDAEMVEWVRSVITHLNQGFVELVRSHSTWLWLIRNWNKILEALNLVISLVV